MCDHQGDHLARDAADAAHRGRLVPRRRGGRARRRVGVGARRRGVAIARSFDHVDLVVSSLEASLAFYTGLLAPLGWRVDGDIVGERGEVVTYVESLAGGELGLRERQSGDRRPDRYAVGLHHLAFRAPSRKVVDERARWLATAGAEIESGPREYQYSPGYYAVFFYDPDGLKLEIVHRRDP